ncbi:DUF5362 family protein [Owenweeksia hongkongensis]|uniref:DUF5362 family protein n=1 Tax=Owenweeksia hongkongensis TaxID=253245 RepID=UPI003A9372EE
METSVDNITHEPSKPRILELDYVREMLNTTANWAKFLAILGFIGVGFMVLAGLGVAAIGTSLPTENTSGPLAALTGGMLGLFYLAMATFYFFPSLYLFQYANKLKVAVMSQDETQLILALDKNKRFFKYVGIMTVVGIALYILFILTLVGSFATGGDFVTPGL